MRARNKRNIKVPFFHLKRSNTEVDKQWKQLLFEIGSIVQCSVNNYSFDVWFEFIVQIDAINSCNFPLENLILQPNRRMIFQRWTLNAAISWLFSSCSLLWNSLPMNLIKYHASYETINQFLFFTFLLFQMAKFQVIRGDRSDKWTLQIKFPQLRDSGIYECQVNTEPKMSMAFRLNVVGKCSKIFYWFYYCLLKSLMAFFVFTIRTISINASIIALKEVITR